MSNVLPGDPLSATEEMLLPYLAEGLSNVEIGQQINRHPYTIKSHLANMYVKTYTANRAGLVAWAFRRGMLK